MTKEKAVQLLLSRNPLFQRLVKKLMSWNEQLTVRDNAYLCGSVEGARRFAKINGLKFKYDCKNASGYQRACRKTLEHYKDLWDSSKTLKQNAERLGVSLATARYTHRIYNLSYARKSNRLGQGFRIETLKKIQKIKALEAEGFNSVEIAKIMRLSRERVRQLGYGVNH